jgi:hypothetical protein
MNNCPACSQPISPNDLACPNCGISLNPGTATAGPTAGGTAKGPSVAAIVVIVIVGIVVVIGCVGGVRLLRVGRAVVRPAPGWVPAGSTVVYDVDDPIEIVPAETPVDMPGENDNTSP